MDLHDGAREIDGYDDTYYHYRRFTGPTGSSVTLVAATSYLGFQFAGWESGGTTYDNVVVVHMEGNTQAVATYDLPWEDAADPRPAPNVFVSTASSAGGRVCSSAFDINDDYSEFSIIGPIRSISDEALRAAYGTHYEGSPRTGVKAIPDPGWEFVSWSDNAPTGPHRLIGTPPYYPPPKGSFHYYAQFRPKDRYVLNLSVGTDCEGYVTVPTPAGTVGPKKYYAPGEKVAISATPGCCTVFDHWSGTAENEQGISIQDDPNPNLIVRFSNVDSEGTKELTAIALFKPIEEHTFSVILTPPEVIPRMCEADLNEAKPILQNQTSQILVTKRDDQFDTAHPNAVWQVVVTPVNDKGGHVASAHVVKPLDSIGDVSGISTQPSSCGAFEATYTPPRFAGQERIKVRYFPNGAGTEPHEDSTEVTITIRVRGLVPMPTGNHYLLIGDKPAHMEDHFVAPDVPAKLKKNS